jgi:hypothetical protein
VPHDTADLCLDVLKSQPHVFALTELPGSTSTLFMFKIAEKRLNQVSECAIFKSLLMAIQSLQKLAATCQSRV